MHGALHRWTGRCARTLVARLRPEGGFGLIELLIAMMVMSIGIMALVAGFSSGIVAVDRASRVSTAGTLADRQMEAYRALAYTEVGVATSTDTTYTSDSAYSATLRAAPATVTCGSLPSTWVPQTACPVQGTSIAPVLGPDGGKYRVDTYVIWYCAIGAQPTSLPASCTGTRAVRKVTVVVRDATTVSRTFIRETSTFDEAT